MNNVNETDFQNETIIESLAKICETADNYTRMAYISLSAYELLNKTSIPFNYRNISSEELNDKPLNKSVNIPITAKVKEFKVTKTGRKLVEIQDYTLVIQILENLNSISIPFHNNSRSFHSTSFQQLPFHFHSMSFFSFHIPFHSIFQQKIFKTLKFTFHKREFYNKNSSLNKYLFLIDRTKKFNLIYFSTKKRKQIV
jgi:hypothetical protein